MRLRQKTGDGEEAITLPGPRFKHVLVTGGSGFIGSHVVPYLVESGYSVRILDLHAPRFTRGDFMRGDVRDPEAVDTAMKGIDAVLHLAAAHHDFGIAYETYFSVNVQGSRTVANAMHRYDVRDVCYFSTVAVYGDAAPPIDEQSVPQPNNPYGKSKLAGEDVFVKWAGARPDRRALILRPTVAFGPNNFANVFSLIRQIDRGRFIQLGKGTNLKSLCFIDNLVAALSHAWLKREQTSRVETFNCVDKPDLDSRTIASTIAGFCRRKNLLALPYCIGWALAVPFDMATKITGRDLGVSTARIHKLAKCQTLFGAEKIRGTGYSQPVSLVDGLRKTTEWYLREGQQDVTIRHIPPKEIASRCSQFTRENVEARP